MSLIKYTCHSSRNTFCCKLAENYSFALQIIIQLQQEKTMIQSADVVFDPNGGHGDVHIVVSCVDIFAFPEGGGLLFLLMVTGGSFYTDIIIQNLGQGIKEVMFTFMCNCLSYNSPGVQEKY